MKDFYQAWLEQSKQNEKIVNEPPGVAHGKALQWTRTRQDPRAALMIAPEPGFSTGGTLLIKAPREESQSWPVDGRRIAMHLEQFEKSDESKHGATYFLMGRSGKQNGFKATAVAISSIFVDLPHTKSHSHAHPEAYLYALEGSGYSEIGGKRYDWVQGDAVHVPPGMMHHQHFNPHDVDMRELRFEFGVRYWMVDQYRGYVTIDKHLKATMHMVD